MQALFGIDTATTDITILNLTGYYPVVDSSPSFDLNLYTATSVWTLVPISGGEGATLVWTAVPRPLPVAKLNGRAQASQSSDASVNTVVTSNFLTSDVLASVASQALVDRPASLQVVLDETVVLTDALGVTLDAIAAATTVDEINSILNNISGTISTGRSGSGGGPLDMNPSTMSVWNSTTVDVADTELYIPASSSVVPYDAGLAPYTYAQTFGAFTVGNYTVQLRQISSGITLAEWVCPLNAVNVPVNF